jgi:glutathione synthase/RimK-type ligase-like ATP-grasp enzyme
MNEKHAQLMLRTFESFSLVMEKKSSDLKLGIFARSLDNEQELYGEQNEAFKTIIAHAEHYGLQCFVFSENDVDFDSKKVSANFLVENSWQRIETELPHVIYYRANNVDESVIKKLQSNSKLINPIELEEFSKDKLKFAEVIEYKQDGIRHPHTIDYNIENLRKMLHDHNTVILKPNRGLQGIGVIEISKNNTADNQSKGDYIIKFNNRNTDNTVYTPSNKIDSTVDDYISQYDSNEFGNFIIQDKIDSPKYRQGEFDFRVLLHRDESDISIDGLACRVGQKDSITSNLSSGGDKVEADKLVYELFNKNTADDILYEIKDRSIQIHKAVEGYIEGEIGELALDFMCDKKGRVYLIEANSKPGIAAFLINSKSNYQIVDKLVRRSKYLCENFQSKR